MKVKFTIKGATFELELAWDEFLRFIEEFGKLKL